MTKNSVNLQDSFLNHVRREGNNIRIVLTSGSELEGVVTGFDNYTVVLVSGEEKHLIYKHAIARLVTQRPSGEGRSARPRKDGDRKALGNEKKPQETEKPEIFNPINVSGISLSRK